MHTYNPHVWSLKVTLEKNLQKVALSTIKLQPTYTSHVQVITCVTSKGMCIMVESVLCDEPDKSKLL